LTFLLRIDRPNSIEDRSFLKTLLGDQVTGEGVKKFQTAKHFAFWLRFAPNNKGSWGKLLSSKVPKGSNLLKIALRNTTNELEISKNKPLSGTSFND